MKLTTIKPLTFQPFNLSTIKRIKAAAFTLAETLIVIGIIGVVAALTLPNLNHATGDKEKVTRVKKIYSALTDAIDRSTAIYGPMDEWCKNIDNWEDQVELVGKRITEFMKVSKACGLDPKGCFSDSIILWPDGSETESSASDYAKSGYSVILSDGTSVLFGYRGSGTVWYEDGSQHEIGYTPIRVDIDGPNKGKNQLGNDIFDFIYAFNEFYSSDIPRNQLSAGPAYYEGKPAYWDNYIAAWVLEFGNLDYLKCPDDLVNGQTSCK